MSNRKYLAADIGSKTIGLAISEGFISNPLQTIRFTEYDFDYSSDELIKICRNHKITDLIIGYPISMNGANNFRTDMVDYFINKLKDSDFIQNNITIYKMDERLTSNLANQYMLTANLSRQKRKTKKDSLAAQIILNNFLKKQSNKNN